MTKSSITLIVIGSIVAIACMMLIMPVYSVWQQGKAGEARLKRAGQERQIIKERAKAELEAAEDTASAIEIVGAMAKKYPEYRYQEFMNAFADALTAEDSPIRLILVPTENQMPILVSEGLIKD